MKDDSVNSGEQNEFAKLLESQENFSSNLQTGQKIKGKVIAISGDDVFIDVGEKEDGVMDIKDVRSSQSEKPTINVGDEIEAFVIGISSQGIKLSQSMSGAGIFALEEAKEAQVPVQGKVKNICKGGYQIEIMGKQAFCPGSQMQMTDSAENLVGKQMDFLITKIENHGKNIVVSRRALLERERKENLVKLLDTIKPGDILEGTVSRMVPFGIFVELAPGVEGMVHLSELSWSHVDKPEEAISVGEKVHAKLLETSVDDKGRQRISLSIKQAIGDPWDNISEKLKPGAIVEGKVRRLAPFGAFIEINPGIEGLVHVSELSWEKRIKRPEDVLNPGDTLQVKIKDINPDEKRISLSLRDAQGDPWGEAEQKFVEGTKVNGVVESKSPYGLFFTLAPGITGLLPLSAIKNAPNSKQLEKLNVGDKLNVIIQKLDSAAKRISLLPENSDTLEEDKSWQDHAKIESGSSHAASGVMAMALQKAFQKKRQGD